MRDSDWSRQNLLRSDWLLLIGATITTIQTLLVLHTVHASVKEVVQFGWTMYFAREMKGLS